ncbi:uncharacterized protein FYW49_008959 [Xenentodon cancila]
MVCSDGYSEISCLPQTNRQTSACRCGVYELRQEEEEMQLAFGTSVETQTQHTQPEVSRESSSCRPTEMLYLRRSNLKHVPDSVLTHRALTYLCLEGNQISSVPDSMFFSLPKLQWLDLRKNRITLLPAEIGSHRCLKTLLLEGNPIPELPPELGNVITLRGLNLRDCPLRFPPKDIVHQGLQAILRFLRTVLAKQPVSVRKTSPVVEKLQLSDLIGSSSEEQDESLDEDGLQRFRELKDSLIQLDKAEINSIARGDKKPKSQVPLITKRNKEAPQKQQTQTKNTKEKKTSEHKQKKPQRQRKQVVCVKYITCQTAKHKGAVEDHSGTGAHSKAGLEGRSSTPQRQTFWPSVTETEEDRSAQKLERQIYACVERIQATHRNPRGTMTEQMAAVEEDLEEMRKLQARLVERKRYPTRHLDKSFSIYPEDTWTSFSNRDRSFPV